MKIFSYKEYQWWKSSVDLNLIWLKDPFILIMLVIYILIVEYDIDNLCDCWEVLSSLNQFKHQNPKIIII